LKQYKPRFDEECLIFLVQGKQAEMQLLQDPNQSNADKEYLIAKIDELETYSKIKNIRDWYRSISDFKNGYQPRSNIVKNGKVDLVTDSHINSFRWRYHF
jgi:hypothetical protein